MPCIYLTENLFNKQHGILPWRYIGSDQYDRPSYLGSCKKLKEDINHIGSDNFTKTILMQYDKIDNKELRRIEATLYLQPNSARNDSTYYNESESYSPGCGKKGMKHRNPRSEEHRRKIVEHRTGSTKDDAARQTMRNKKIGTKAKESTRELMSLQRRGALNSNALTWTVITPTGEVHEVSALRTWVKEHDLKFNEVYGSKNGWKTIKHGTGKGGGRKKKELIQS